MHEYYVYILRCDDGSLYTGITNHLERRLAEHQSGKAENSYVAGRLPATLMYSHSFQYVLDAIAFEKQVKGWSRRKKEALIAGNQKMLEKNSKNGMVRRITYIQEGTCKRVMVRLCSP